MALILKDRVKVTTTTTGTGTLALGSAQFGFQDFSGFADGSTTYYTIVDNATGAWETGLGTYAAAGPSLARTSVLASSTGSAIDFGAGPKDVFVCYPAGRAITTDGGVFTGHVEVPAGAAGAQAPQAQEIPALLGITGAVVYFARDTAPAGWLKANGAAISRTTYAALFSVIGTTFGSGDGSTTFNIPDLRGEFLRGWDDGRGVDSGRAFGSAQATATQAHQHYQTHNYTASFFTSNGNYYGQGVTVTNNTTVATSGMIAVSGESRPRNVALLACIKF